MSLSKSGRWPMLLLVSLALLSACGPGDADVSLGDDELGNDSDSLTQVTDDDLNGLFKTTLNGAATSDDAMIESWAAVGIRLTLNGAQYPLTRTGDTLTGPGVTLAVHVNGSSVNDDSLDGTVNGQPVVMKRDTAVKPPIAINFPGDRPFRSFLIDTLSPAAQRDRESYVSLNSATMSTWLHNCELYRSGSWLRKFKGATWSDQATSFNNVVYAVNYVKVQPRRMTKQYKFFNTLTQNLADQTQAGLWVSTFGMYFPASAGRSLRLKFTPDSTGYFITDRPARGALIGVVAMDTPTHHTLASTFGRQLLDLGAMPAEDSPVYARTMMDLLVKSDVSRATQLSGTGRSALTDWYSVMAIEDYRGVAFGYPTLGWGYNMTQVQFYGLVARSLARPGAVDSAGNPVVGQVIVGGELRPGEASYADVLNGGADMQEYGDMARLKQLATSYLASRHPELIAQVRAAFAGMVPDSQVDYRAGSDIFHWVGSQLYDAQGRYAVLKDPARANAAAASVVALLDTLNAESAQFEAFITASGYVKSNVAAPKSTGF